MPAAHVSKTHKVMLCSYYTSGCCWQISSWSGTFFSHWCRQDKTYRINLFYWKKARNWIVTSLVYLHALTGCDTVSCFFGRRKKKALQTLMKHSNLIKLFAIIRESFVPQKLASDWHRRICLLHLWQRYHSSEWRTLQAVWFWCQLAKPPSTLWCTQTAHRAAYQTSI